MPGGVGGRGLGQPVDHRHGTVKVVGHVKREHSARSPGHQANRALLGVVYLAYGVQ